MKSAIFAAIFLMMASSALAGRITPWGDPEFLYPNSGRIQYMDLFFTLDTKLPTGHVLRVTLPFSTSPTIASTAVYAAGTSSKGTWVAASSSLTSSSATATGTTRNQTTAAPFHNFFTLSADLAAATPYVIRITFTNSPTDVGFLGWAQIETMSPALSVTSSSGNDQAISYDLNNAFAPIHIFAAPGIISASNFNLTSDGNSAIGGQTSIRQISFIPTQNFFYWPLIQLSWDNALYTISNLTSIDTGVSTTATPLTVGTGAGNYFSTSTNTSLSIFHNAQLFTNQTVRYNISTANPASTTTQTINFSLRIMHRYNLNLTDVSANQTIIVQNTSAPAAGSTVSITSYQILLSWGIDPNGTLSSNTALSKVFSIYTTLAANPVYQGLRWVFGLSAALSSGNYTVTLTVCNSTTSSVSNCDVLENSIVSSFTGASCHYSWGTTRQIACTSVSALATTNNTIGGRIWYMGAQGNSNNGVLTTATAGSFPSTFSDTSAGIITITQINSTFTASSGSLSSNTNYNKVTYNYLPLVNINGNGPLAALPVTATLQDGTTNYNTLWGTTNVTNLATNGSATAFAPYVLPTAATWTAGTQFGGIYGTPGAAGTKYNVALFTSAVMQGATGVRSTFNGGTSTFASSLATVGLDLFLNPNVYGQTGTSTTAANPIASCWIGTNANKPTATTAPYTSFNADSTTVSTTHCFTLPVSASNANYLRLRQLITTIAATQGPIGGSSPNSVESATATSVYMTFYWENAISITSNYTGASLKADTNIGDFYGVFYQYAFTTSSVLAIRSGNAATTADVAELPITGTGISAFTVGTPFMWSQMIVGPLGSYAVGSAAANTNYYYKQKTVFISGYLGTVPTGTFDPVNYNANSLLQMIRIRGSFNNSNGDTNMYPTSGKIALFIGTAAVGTATAGVWNPMGGVNTTKIDGTAGYNNATTILGAPLVSAGSIRCWNSGTVGNCFHDRFGRALSTATPFATANAGVTGIVGAMDLYQIITSDANYTSANFSISILVAPKFAAITSAMYWYRFGFYNNANGYYMVQSWDQAFDAQSTVGTAYTTLGNAFSSGAAPTQYPTAGTTCFIPYNSANTTTVSNRLVPVGTELDNSAIASMTLSFQPGAGTPTAITTTPFKQGYVSWCVQWNFKVNSPTLNSTALENGTLGDKCAAFDYLSAETPAVSWYCVVCPITNTLPTSASSVAITNFYSGPATNTYTYSATNIAGDDGAIKEFSYCPNTIASTNTTWQPQVMTATGPSTSYNIQGQKISIAFTTPSTLALADSIQLLGKYQANSSADSTFPYITLDTAYACRLAPTASTLDVSTYVTCTAGNASSGTWNITSIGTIPTNQSTVTSWTLMIWGVNGNTWLAAYPAATTYFVIQTMKGGQIVDQSNTTNTNYISWALSNNTNSTFGTNLIAYQRPYVGARGYFKFDVVFSARSWFYSDKVVLNLDSVISSTVNTNSSVVKCRITDTNDNIWQGFQSCTLAGTASPPTLTIIAFTPTTTTKAVYPYDLSAGTGIRVYLDNMVTIGAQTNRTIWGSVTFVGISGSGTNQVLSKNVSNTDVTSSTLNTTLAFASTGANLTKYWTAANDFQDMVFSLIPSAPFNSTCRATIVFPSYYNPGLTTRTDRPYCTVNGVYTQCLVGQVDSTGATILAKGIRTLVIYGFSGSVSANGSLVIRVSGIQAPPANYTAETFWIQINGDNSEQLSTIMNGGTITDASYVAPTTAVMPLNVNWFSVSASTTRSFVTFTWSFGLNVTAGAVNTTQGIQVVFPEHWGLGWGEFTPTCTVFDFQNNSLTFASASTTNASFGNIVQLNVSTQIPAGNVVTLSCANVRSTNVEGTYRSQDVAIRVVDMNGGAVYQRSAPGAHNVNFTYAFAKGSSQNYVSWSTTTTLASPGSLTAGTYSLSVTASVLSRSSRSFFITPSNSNFAFLSSTAPFWLVYGATSNSTLLGCSQSVAVGLYALTFTVSDNSSTYIAPPVMWVSVNSNVQTIAPSSASLTAFYSSSSLSSTAPLIFDLTAMPPFSDITITPNVTSTGVTNFTISPSSIKLTPAAPKAYFTFTSTSGTSAVSSATYNFAVSGTNAASYSVPSSVTVSLTTDSGTGSVNTPSLSVAADSSDTSAATSKVITFTLSQVTQATVYWVVTLQGQSITDATAIQANAAALTAYNMNSANQAQYFSNYVVTATKTIYTITNLFPNTGYTVSAVAVSNTNKSSTVASFTFVTGANVAVIQRWLFNYTTYPSQAQRQSLLCLITQTLSVPAINVRNVNGEICGNTTAFYAASNSTGDLGVYFYPLQASADTTMTATALQTALNGTTSNALSSMNTTLSAGTSGSGIGWMSAYVDIPIIRNAAPGITLPSSIPSSQLTTSSIYFSLTTSNDTGFLFVTLCSNSSTTPTAVAMKQAAANITTISGALSTQVFYFYPGASLTYNFTGLSAATSYNMYVVASNNDPSFLQNFTSVTAISVTTPSTGTNTGAGQMGVIFSVMTVFASVISLMFF